MIPPGRHGATLLPRQNRLRAALRGLLSPDHAPTPTKGP